MKQSTRGVGAAAPRSGGRGERRARRRMDLLLLAPILVFSLIITALVQDAWQSYRSFQTQVDLKEQRLAALKKQLRAGQRRQAELESPKGNEELLLKHGYLPPGDRILLFPPTREERQKALLPRNDLAPHPPIAPSRPRESAWKRAGRVMGGWWNSLRDAKKSGTDESRGDAPPASAPPPPPAPGP